MQRSGRSRLDLAEPPGSRVRLLRREMLRHTGALLVSSGLAFTCLLAYGSFNHPAAGTRYDVLGVTLAFSTYGPVHLALTRLAFRDLTGAQLGRAMQQSLERHRVVRAAVTGGPRSWAVLIVAVGTATTVLLAIGGAKQDPVLLIACVLGVAGTWVLLVAIFAVEYLRRWALEQAVQFPGAAPRRFSDFVYLAVQMSTTFSSSDVQLLTPAARSLASVHSIVAFAYSTVIIAVFASLVTSFAT